MKEKMFNEVKGISIKKQHYVSFYLDYNPDLLDEIIDYLLDKKSKISAVENVERLEFSL